MPDRIGAAEGSDGDAWRARCVVAAPGHRRGACRGTGPRGATLEDRGGAGEPPDIGEGGLAHAAERRRAAAERPPSSIGTALDPPARSTPRAGRAKRHAAFLSRTTQRKPMWLVELSTACAWRAAGR